MHCGNQQFTKLAEIMRNNAGAECFGKGASTGEVAEAELQIGTELPESYRCFLREFGTACWPEYIYGLHSHPQPGLHVVLQTEEARRRLRPLLPRHLIPFSPDGWGNSYCLDTSRLVNGECPVVLWNHERDEDQEPEQTHGSFVDWLANRIEFQLEE